LGKDQVGLKRRGSKVRRGSNEDIDISRRMRADIDLLRRKDDVPPHTLAPLDLRHTQSKILTSDSQIRLKLRSCLEINKVF
jgi:hypothetical protein